MELVQTKLSGLDRQKYKDLNPRQKLIKLGYILIRGKLLRSEDVINFTPQQLEMINKAGIKVISAYDGAIEYPTIAILETINQKVKKIEKIDTVIAMADHIKKLEAREVEPEYSDQWRIETMKNIQKFKKDPLHTTISDYRFREHGQGEFANGVFSCLAEGYSDEMTMDIDRSTHHFRVIDYGQCKILVQMEEYWHDGQSGGYSGDVNYHISMSVIDQLSIIQKIANLIDIAGTSSQDRPKIVTGSNGYFSGIIGEVLL